MDDLIRRQDAYKVLTDYYHHKTEIQHMGLKEALNRVPSAQPEIEERMSETEQNVPNDDFISRKGAIDTEDSK